MNKTFKDGCFYVAVLFHLIRRGKNKLDGIQQIGHTQVDTVHVLWKLIFPWIALLLNISMSNPVDQSILYWQQQSLYLNQAPDSLPSEN